MRITYHAVFQYDYDGICIHFPDVPLAITCAFSFEEGVYMAKDVLILVLHRMPVVDLPADCPAQIKLEEKQQLVPITIEMENRVRPCVPGDFIDFAPHGKP